MTTAIRAEGLSKCYRLGQIGFRSFREELEHRLRRRRGRPAPARRVVAPEDADRIEGDRFWALRDVSFEVARGEIIGVIGRNGAGKSTLLKLLSRVTEPTRGRAELCGRVSSLLEVGTGFHPELTGRENVYLSGSIFGMKKAEITRRFDEIVAFSEVGEFIDTPVKRYSSGMYVRLAFGVAAHLDPDILIVDEVLAVGDAAFQRKCLGRMGAASSHGRTVLFVSHNMAAVNNLCQRAVWLDGGRIAAQGATGEIVHAYLQQSSSASVPGHADLREWPNRYGCGDSRIVSGFIRNHAGKVDGSVVRAEPMAIGFRVETSRPRAAAMLSVQVVADTGEKVLHMSHYDTPGLRLDTLQGVQDVEFEVPAVPLCAGSYNLIIGIHEQTSAQPIDVVLNVLPFEAYDTPRTTRPFQTVARNSFCWVPNRCRVVPVAGGRDAGATPA